MLIPGLAELAAALDVPARHLAAVIEVECPGAGLVAGRPVIRLEVHRLWQESPPELRAAVDARFYAGGPKPFEGHVWLTPAVRWVQIHKPGAGGQALEWLAWECARSIVGLDVAVRVTSWGLGQVMGEWRELGYPSPEALVTAAGTEAGQLDMMGRYLRARPALVEAIRAGDWRQVARVYNGRGQVEAYAARLREAAR